MLSIKKLSVSLKEQSILKEITCAIAPGSLHVIIGHNGSGKSSLAATLLGHPNYTVTEGDILFEGQSILALSTDKRARLGIFLAHQNPCAIPGVRVLDFLYEAYRAQGHTLTAFSSLAFEKRAEDTLKQVGLSETYLQRSLYEGFSGGEKKRLELAQLLLLRPKIAILDELDSGLDQAGIEIVIESIQKLRIEHPEISFILITHNHDFAQRLAPTHMHTMHQGQLN